MFKIFPHSQQVECILLRMNYKALPNLALATLKSPAQILIMT